MILPPMILSVGFEGYWQSRFGMQKFGTDRLRRGARVLALFLGVALACGFQFSNAYYSPRNPEREPRRLTRYIILHTTEAPSSSALPKLRDCGETHFCVDTDGRVYRVVDHRRVAFHCGRSMWEGRVNNDDCSVGIEVVGHHDQEITAAQYLALVSLLKELQFLYRVPDERVLTHSMVAYGSPNKWFHRSHRGRKRCGMLFARWDVRRRLPLAAQPHFDPDVRAGRLMVGDPYLEQVLYGTASEQDKALARRPPAARDVIGPQLSAWDIARDAFDDATTLYVYPDGTRRIGTQIRDFHKLPYGTRVIVPAGERNRTDRIRIIGTDGASAQEIAGDEAGLGTTIYLFAGGRFVRGSDLKPAVRAKLPAGTRMLVGFAAGGPISATRHAYDICGARWNQADTFYLLPGGGLKSGSEVTEGKIPAGTVVFYRS